MVFEALAFLIAGPVHEQAVLRMHHDHSYQHVAHDSECGNAAEESDDEAQSAEELGADGEKGDGRRDSHLMGEETHGAAEAVSAEPAQHLLRAVCEEYAAHHHTKNGYSKVVVGVHYSLEHDWPRFRNGYDSIVNCLGTRLTSGPFET